MIVVLQTILVALLELQQGRPNFEHFFLHSFQWYPQGEDFSYNGDKLTSVFHASVLLLIINFVVTLSKFATGEILLAGYSTTAGCSFATGRA